jgi:hypothetical protein
MKENMTNRMKILQINEKIELLKIPTLMSLLIIIIIGFSVRAYFTYWNMNFESPDAFLFLLEANSFVEGNFDKFGIRAIWPMIISGFFSIFQFTELVDKMNLIRMISISISTISIILIYKISKEFVKNKYALFVAALFAFDPTLIENSVLGIREPIFLLLGLISIYYIIHKNEKFIFLAFIFAGLAFNTKIAGIALPIFLCIFILLRFKSYKEKIKFISIGIVIFLIIILPYIILTVEQGSIPFVWMLTNSINQIQTESISPSTYSESNEDVSIVETSIVREILHFGRINLPLTGIFAIIGFFSWIQTRDFKFYAVISSVVVILLIALPMYFQSAEYRNLLLASPFLFILAGVGLERVIEKRKLKKNLLIILTIILIFGSIITINMLDNRDKEESLEKEKIAKIIVNKFSGRFMGDLYGYINQNIFDVKHGGVKGTSNSLYYNDSISITMLDFSITSIELLMEESKKLGVNYLIIDNKFDNRYPIFDNIFKNEEKYLYLEKVFEYDSEKIDLKIKIFKINFEKYHKLQ